MAQSGTSVKHSVLVSIVLFAACVDAHMGNEIPHDSVSAGSSAGTGDGAGASAAGTGASVAGATAAGRGAPISMREPKQHNAADQMCDYERTKGDDPSSSRSFGCMSDAECTKGDNGRCINLGRGSWQCTYDECHSNVDCSGGPCICGTGPAANNRCYQGNCQTDSDCGSNGYCSPTFGSCGAYSGVVAYYCHTTKDACTDDADCPGGWCQYEPTVGHWICASGGCVG